MSNKASKDSRAQWASSLGFILAAAGSAVGLGNIWKFPGKAYEGGGGVYILTYILIVILIGATAMMAELTVGRSTQKNAVGAFRILAPKWKWVGGLGVFTGFVILGYYSQVGGWVLQYIVSYLTKPGEIYGDPQGFFLNQVLGADRFPVLGAFVFPLLFIACVVLVIVRGVEGGIERFNKVAMPALFLLLLALLGRSLTLPGAGEGLRYLLTFDLSSLNGSVLLSALGQAFYSLSLGMGIMCTYGSYVKHTEDLGKNMAMICSLDTLVALIAAFIIIPAVFATGVQPGKGASFAFVSLAGVFERMPLGSIFGVIFYTLLFFAALTSAISLLEGTVAYLTEEKGLGRTKATVLTAAGMFFIGVLYTLSQVHMEIRGIWLDGASGLTFPAFGDFLEFFTDRLMTPLGALAYCIFVGWVWGPQKAVAEIEREGVRFPLAKPWAVLVKYVAPSAIVVILFAGMVMGLTLS